MTSVSLEPDEWNRVLLMLSTQPWRDANTIIMKIGDQLRAQAGAGAGRPNGPLEEGMTPNPSDGRQRASN